MHFELLILRFDQSIVAEVATDHYDHNAQYDGNYGQYDACFFFDFTDHKLVLDQSHCEELLFSVSV